MSVPKFYLDVHLPKVAAVQLRRKGIDVVHCSEIGQDNWDDIAHLEFALQQLRIMVTCDEGFEGYSANWHMQGRVHSGIVFFRMEDQCQSISVIVKELEFLALAADYETDLYNRVWRI